MIFRLVQCSVRKHIQQYVKTKNITDAYNFIFTIFLPDFSTNLGLGLEDIAAVGYQKLMLEERRK